MAKTQGEQILEAIIAKGGGSANKSFLYQEIQQHACYERSVCGHIPEPHRAQGLFPQ